MSLTGASAEDWDDNEGYYQPKIGELIDDRYLVQGLIGRGVYAGVVRAQDQRKNQREVALKIIRTNSYAVKAAQKEVTILETLRAADAENKGHIIRLASTFVYQ